MKLPNFRTALVIADDCGLRKSIVQYLKHEGWIVHGITNGEHAFPILAYIPYELVIVDCELAGIDGKEFVRLLHNAREWRAMLLRMSRLASNYELLEELKAHTDRAKRHMYLIRTITSGYQAIPPVKNCAAMKGLIVSSELLFHNCGAANARALNAALICTSLDILHYELAKLERLRLYARLLSDRHAVTILNAVLDDSIEAKHRLAELMGFCVALDSVSAPKSTPFPAIRPPTR